MIEGTVESLDASGVFTGWLRDTADPDPVIVEIRQSGHIIARAVAVSFRLDLLRGRHGHGHYGFRARALSALPSGPALFELFLPRHGQSLRTRLVMPQPSPVGPVTVKDLLQAEPAWTQDHVLAHLACLNLPQHHASMGTPRFIDAAYRFALARWPSPPETQVYAAALDGARGSWPVGSERYAGRAADIARAAGYRTGHGLAVGCLFSVSSGGRKRA